jgi:outer membrane biosynthesis protein TonB
LVIGVIVAGLGIGALISAYQNRGTPPPQLGAGIPPVTPVPQATPAPDQSPLGLPSATPSPTPSPTAAPSTAAVSTPSPSPAPTAAPTERPTPVPTERPTPVPTERPTPVPTERPTPAPAPTVRPTDAPPAATPTPRAAAADATGTVRRYLDAIVAGNTTAASALLSPGGTVKEAAFLDDAARITSLRVTRTDATGTFVEADITAARGSYVATFHVTNAAGGGTIDQHDYIKV